VFNETDWPDWIHYLKLVAAFLLTVGLGAHAYYWHKKEALTGVSTRKWMYWLYSIVFLAAGTANFTKLCVTAAFRDYEKSSFHLGYLTLLLALSYLALQTGVRRRSNE